MTQSDAERERQLRAALFAVMREFDKTFDRETAIAEALVAERERVRQMEEALQHITALADSKEAVLMTGSELAAKITSIAYPVLDATEPEAEEGEA